ncbi:MAG: reductive dehalogenase [bacterium]|nr:reductive dehalogenase [bacterium]
MGDGSKRGVSRRDLLKMGGVAGAALQVGGVAGAALEAGRSHRSYGGWESFEGDTQFFNRKPYEIAGKGYEKVGPSRRPARATEYVFGRAYSFRQTLMQRGEDEPEWTREELLEALGEPFTTYYKENPEVFDLDLKREREIYPKRIEDQAKYDAYFELAQAWSHGWSEVFSHYPARIQDPPEKSDFERMRPEPLVPKSPELAAKLVKTVAHHYGSSLVGVARLNPDWVYDVGLRGGDEGPFEVPAHWEYAIAVGVPHEWDQMLSNPAHGTSYDGYARARIAAARLAAFIRGLGYPARAHMPPGSYDLIVPPILVDAGLGQHGRNGVVITPEFGANFRAAVVTTNFPMTVDKPIDFGVADFCNTCKICAEQCPSGSISFADSNEGMNTRGYRHWEINQTSCFNFWQQAMGPTGCRLCIATCPYSRKNNWVHGLARTASAHDPTGAVDHAMTWMQKRFFEAPGAQAYLPPPDGRFAGYRSAPEWLDIERWFEVDVINPQVGG